MIAVLAAVLLARLALLVAAACLELARRRRDPYLLDAPDLPRVTVVVPAFNEERVLAGTVASLLAADHPDVEIVLVDDGSTDGTAALARALAARHPTVRALVLPRNGGKSAALNAGISVATGSHLVTVDADTVLDPKALRILCATLSRPGVDAVASNVKVGNRVNLLTRWQSVEYVMGLALGRRAQAGLDCITTIPGAACALRPDALAAAGGYSSDTVVEDTDLTLSLLEAGRRVVFQPAAIAYTEAPETWRGLVRQRARWLRGYVQCIVKHRRSFFRADVLGWFGMPNLLLTHVVVYVLVPLSFPSVVTLVRAVGNGTLLATAASLFGLEVALAAACYAVDREDPRELLLVPARQLVWPFFEAVVWVTAWWQLAAGARRTWGKPAREGRLADAAAEGKAGIVRDR